jgi:hypothetical protein
MTPNYWTAAIFNGNANDGIVAVYSQVYNAQVNNSSLSGSQIVNLGNGATVFPGLVHSPGTEQLGFTGPNVLDSPQIANQVLSLLNTPVSNASSFATIQ